MPTQYTNDENKLKVTETTEKVQTYDLNVLLVHLDTEERHYAEAKQAYEKRISELKELIQIAQELGITVDAFEGDDPL